MVGRIHSDPTGRKDCRNHYQYQAHRASCHENSTVGYYYQAGRSWSDRTGQRDDCYAGQSEDLEPRAAGLAKSNERSERRGATAAVAEGA